VERTHPEAAIYSAHLSRRNLREDMTAQNLVTQNAAMRYRLLKKWMLTTQQYSPFYSVPDKNKSVKLLKFFY